MAATLPGSTFVGIDLSARQIAMAQQISDRLGLDNVTWQAASLMDQGDSLGTFDYILCHGVFSWVPPPVQEKILTICRRQLAPQGVAYVSYNTYPGWHSRGMVRDMLNYHVQDLAEPQARVAQARTFLDFLSQAVPDRDGALARTLHEEADIVRKTPDYYVCHEHLAENNDPVYFSQFMRRARAAGLQFLGESEPDTYLARLEPAARDAVKAMSADLIQLEQYLDFLFNRAFRRTLLCHEQVVLNRTPSLDRLAKLLVSSLVRPEPAPPDAGASSPTPSFRTYDGTTISTGNPQIVAALSLLHDLAPQAILFDDLHAAIQEKLGNPGDSPAAAAACGKLAGVVLQLFLSRALNLHTHMPRFSTSAGARPRAGKLARLQAQAGIPVASFRHFVVDLNPFERALLAQLDGARDLPALIDALSRKIVSGELDAQQGGQPVRDPVLARRIVAASLEPSLARLAKAAVLEAEEITSRNKP
jgi:methyltransferase-like protein